MDRSKADWAVPCDIAEQLSNAFALVRHHLAPTLVGVHAYGSLLVGGLKRYSDIDVLVTVTEPINETTRKALMNGLLKLSAAPGASEKLRALEVTAVVRSQLVPWRYPPRREFQFGEWLRDDILAGRYEPAVEDPDVAILLTTVRQHCVVLYGLHAMDLFDDVPQKDLFRAFSDVLKLWEGPEDWAGDERNVLLTLARIWCSAVTGTIVPKHVAASWVAERVPFLHRRLLQEARGVYEGDEDDTFAQRASEVADTIMFLIHEIAPLLSSPQCPAPPHQA